MAQVLPIQQCLNLKVTAESGFQAEGEAENGNLRVEPTETDWAAMPFPL